MTEPEKAADPPVIIIERNQFVDRHISITENRAPTDESVKLLREMEQKAEERIVETVRVQNTVFDCVVHSWWEAHSDKQCFRAVFKLNGKNMEAKYECDRPREGDHEYRMKAATGLRDEIAKIIATEAISDAFAAMHRNRA